MFRYGLENLLQNQRLIKELRGRKVGLVAHPASVDQELRHSIELLHEKLGKSLTCGFGPQHGIRGEKQDNMIESADIKDPKLGIPIFSLYGEVRRPTKDMLAHFDVVLVDLQDLGCRIYTFLTTLFYLIDDCAAAGKSVWVLDRPNPVGRPIEGSLLEDHFHSFVGAAPMPMRHGLTLGEAAQWYIAHRQLDVDFRLVKMTGYKPNGPGFGWPEKLAWVNPSPNAPNFSMARVYPGSVMVEGTNLSEARGTTRPLEILGATNVDPDKWTKETLKILGPKFSKGFKLRSCFFEPTFHKFKGELCAGIQTHVDPQFYKHKDFKPYRLHAALFKAFHQMRPDFDLWRPTPYEYEFEKLPIDLISGSEFLRTWVEDSSARMGDLDRYLTKDENHWSKAIKGYLAY